MIKRIHKKIPKPTAPIIKPPLLLDALKVQKFFCWKQLDYTKLQSKIFLFHHVMIWICNSKRCCLIVEVLKDSFTRSRKMASKFIFDGLVPLLGKEICNNNGNSTSKFTLMLDQTTTKQNKKRNCQDISLKQLIL